MSNLSKEISFSFQNGLGDNSLFAHSLPIYQEHGYKVLINCNADKWPVFEAAGCEFTNDKRWEHGWYHPNIPVRHTRENDWHTNKTGFNLTQNPYHHLLNKTEKELWNDLISRKLTIKTKGKVDSVSSFVSGLGRFICLHTKANTSPHNKDFNHLEENQLYTTLLDNTDCNLLLLDWDNRCEFKIHPRITRLKDYGNANLYELAHIIEHTQLLIGVDSGPLHFSRFAETPAIGVWRRHHPAKFALPKHNHLQITENNYENLNYFRRHSFNIIDAAPDAALISSLACKLMNAAEAKDLALRHYIRKMHQSQANQFYQDRHVSFSLALEDSPKVIVETGCQRQQEDYTAGCSTTIFGWYARNNGCCFTSVDNDPEHIRTAKEATVPFPVSFDCSDSVAFFQNYTGEKIDLLYLDSMDTDIPEHAEHCLREYEAAKRHLSESAQILIDDTPKEGKGKLVIPAALADGWKVAYHGYQVLLCR